MNEEQTYPTTRNAQHLHPPGERLTPSSDLVEYFRAIRSRKAGRRRAVVLGHRLRAGVETEALVRRDVHGPPPRSLWCRLSRALNRIQGCFSQYRRRERPKVKSPARYRDSKMKRNNSRG